MTHPTLQEARAALDAADGAQAQAEAEFNAARDRLTAARQAFFRARKEVEAARDREEKNAVARDRNKAKKLAAQYGIKIEREDFGDGNIQHFVIGPDDVYGGGWDTPEAAAEHGVRADPCGGDHYCGSWSEVLHNVGIYVDDLKAWNAETAAKLAEG